MFLPRFWPVSVFPSRWCPAVLAEAEAEVMLLSCFCLVSLLVAHTMFLS